MRAGEELSRIPQEDWSAQILQLGALYTGTILSRIPQEDWSALILQLGALYTGTILSRIPTGLERTDTPVKSSIHRYNIIKDTYRTGAHRYSS